MLKIRLSMGGVREKTRIQILVTDSRARDRFQWKARFV